MQGGGLYPQGAVGKRASVAPQRNCELPTEPTCPEARAGNRRANKGGERKVSDMLFHPTIERVKKKLYLFPQIRAQIVPAIITASN